MNKIYSKWYLNICTTIAGLVLAYYFGFLNLIWESDQTKITSIIAGLWLYATLTIGYCEKGRIEKGGRDHGRRWHKWTEIRMKHVKFMAETCAVLGMIGTVLGFIIMANTSGLGDATTTQGLKDAVHAMLAGFGVAMFTTLVGALAKLSIDSQIVSRS